MQSEARFNAGRHPVKGRDALLHALESLQRRQVSPGQLSRVTVERDGVLHVEAEADGSRRWFRCDGASIEELYPVGDSNIPLLQNPVECEPGSDAELLSYRPGRRVVFGHADARRPRILKGYRRRGARRAVICHEIAMAACEKGGFEVPRLLEYSPEKESLLMARQSGASPAVAVESGPIWAAIGASLRRFQSTGVTAPLRKFGVRDELSVLDELAGRFLLWMPTLPDNWQSGRESLAEAAAKLPPAELCLAHRDLHDGQLLVSGDAVSLLDFDLLCSADSALDTGNLLAHIVLREMQSGSEPAASVCGSALLSGMDRQDEAGFTLRVLFYQATSFYRLALLYALRPRWAHLPAALVGRGMCCIDKYNRELE